MSCVSQAEVETNDDTSVVTWHVDDADDLEPPEAILPTGPKPHVDPAHPPPQFQFATHAADGSVIAWYTCNGKDMRPLHVTETNAIVCQECRRPRTQDQVQLGGIGTTFYYLCKHEDLEECYRLYCVRDPDAPPPEFRRPRSKASQKRAGPKKTCVIQ